MIVRIYIKYSPGQTFSVTYVNQMATNFEQNKTQRVFWNKISVFHYQLTFFQRGDRNLLSRGQLYKTLNYDLTSHWVAKS